MTDKKVTELDISPAVDRSADLLYIVNNGVGSSNKITPNLLLGITGNPVGTSDSQTLTNKTLASPVITNPTMTADAISEFTTGNGVTIDGLSIKDGALNTNDSVATNNIEDGAVTMPKIYNPYRFSVYRNAAQNTGAGADSIVNFDTVTSDPSNSFDITTHVGRYTAKIAGWHWFNSGIVCASGVYLLVSLYKNGVLARRGNLVSSSSGSTGGNVCGQLSLDVDDYVEICCQANIAKAIETTESTCYFEGCLVSVT